MFYWHSCTEHVISLKYTTIKQRQIYLFKKDNKLTHFYAFFFFKKACSINTDTTEFLKKSNIGLGTTTTISCIRCYLKGMKDFERTIEACVCVVQHNTLHKV